MALISMGRAARAALFALALTAGPASGRDAEAATCWSVEPGSLILVWRVLWGETEITGGFSRADVTVVFDRDAPEEAVIEAVIAVDSLTASDPEAVALLKDPAWLAIDSFPRARYEAKGLTPLGGADGRRHYRAQGRLTLKGRSEPLALDIWLTETDGMVAAEAHTTIDRTRFGIGSGPIARATASEVALELTLTARPAACARSPP